MVSQFAMANGSNPLFDPNMWTEMDLGQHMYKWIVVLPNKELIVENDDIHNVYGEHEDGQAILGYDYSWYVTIDSDKNELDSRDENDEYTKPICYDTNLDVGVGYASFDDHNETHPIDDPSEAHFFRNFMNLLK